MISEEPRADQETGGFAHTCPRPTLMLLAATFDHACSADSVRRTQLLDRAAELLRNLESAGSMTADDRETKGRIDTLKR